LCQVAAIHGYVGSGDKRRFRRSQPHHGERNLYVTSFTANRITELDPAGGTSAFANTNSGLNGPLFLAMQPGFVSPPGVLFIRPSGSNVVLNWGTPLSFVLQAAPAVTGTYTNVPNPTSPYTNAINGSNLFFRTLPAN